METIETAVASKAKTAKITKMNVIKGGRVVLTLDNNKKALVDRDSLETYKLLGIEIKTGSSLIVEDSVNPLTSEVSPEWCRIAA